MAHSHTTYIQHYPDCNKSEVRVCRCETRRYAKVLGIACIIFALEVAGGLLSGSLSLLADAGHVFTDMGAIIVSIIVAELARAHFGEKKHRKIGFWINVSLLACISIWIATEAWDRWYNPREVASSIMLCIAVIGGFGNWLQHKTLGVHSHNQTSRVLDFHILADLVMSIGVVLAGVIILFTNWYWVDTLVSATIALFIGAQVVRLVLNPDGTHHH